MGPKGVAQDRKRALRLRSAPRSSSWRYDPSEFTGVHEKNELQMMLD
jgi:hypothetical protein